MRFPLFGLTLAALACAAPPLTLPATAGALSPEQWREDLGVLVEKLEQTHPDAFHHTPQEVFHRRAAALDEKIPDLEDDQVVVEMARLVALVGDGHTRLTLPLGSHTGLGRTHASTEGPKIPPLHRLPVDLYLFSDGLFVRSIPMEHAWAVGSRVLTIGDVGWEEAIALVSDVVHRDNEMTVKSLVPHFLAIPEVLEARGVTPGGRRVRFGVETAEGEKRELWLEAPPDNGTDTGHDESQWVDMSDASPGPLPLYLKDPTSHFWFEHLAEERAVYVQYNAVQNKEGETTEQFFGRVFDFIEANDVERLVVDVRLNGGGNNFLNRPLIHGLICSHKVNKPGKLIFIIGRGTFSAAQNCVTHVENHTHVRFVGEPTAGKPNHYGDSQRILLPNSGLTLRVSTLYWQDSDPRDDRTWTPPHVAVEVSSDDYRNRRDPVLEAALEYVDEGGLLDRMRAALEGGSLEEAVGIYRKFRSDDRYVYQGTEPEMNMLGYALIEHGMLDWAVEIFKLNVEAYPESFNVYDSLGEAYMLEGEHELAIANYERSLSLNPQNRNAVEMIERMKSQGEH